MGNDDKKIDLFSEGLVNIEGQNFIKLNLKNKLEENSYIITDLQMAQLLGYSKGMRQVREIIKRNYERFKIGVNLFNLQNKNNKDLLQQLGYSKQSLKQADNIWALNHEGFILFLQISEMSKDDKILQFEYSYFGIRKMEISILRYELCFGQMLLKVLNGILNIIPQFICCNNRYKIDFYIPELNLAIEYDEEGNKQKIFEDKKREKEIYNELKCSFVRVEKSKELEGINEILKFIHRKVSII